MMLEKQAWVGALYGFVACLALMVLMGHTFKKYSDGSFRMIESQNLFLRDGKALKHVGTNGSEILLIGARTDVGSNIAIGSDGTAVGIGNHNVSAVASVTIKNDWPIRYTNVAGSASRDVIRMDVNEDIVFGNITDRLLISSEQIGTGKLVDLDAADSCGAGFKCLRVPN